MEFALQLQVGTDEWGERILPRRRFFPAQIDHRRWLHSSTLSLDEQEVLVRIIARQVSDTTVEFGLQWVRTMEHGWGERILPDGRFFPRDVDHMHWLNSSTVTIGEYFTTDLDDLPTSAQEAAESGGVESGEEPAYIRYKFLGGQNYGIAYRDGQTLTMSVPEGEVVYYENREFEGRDPLFGLVLIFPSGLELEMHPDLIDGVLARTDITDPLAVSVLDSLRRSIQELEYTVSGPESQTGTRELTCASVTEPYPASPVVVPDDLCVTLSGSGPLTLSYRDFQISLTVPEWQDGSWFMVIIRSSEHPQHQLYMAPDSNSHLGFDLATGEEVGRRVVGADAAEVNALFDGIAESVSVTSSG